MNREDYERTNLIITEFDAANIITTSETTDFTPGDYEGNLYSSF